MILKSIFFVLLFSLSIVVASRVEARSPTPSKRFVIHNAPRQPAPSKRVDSLNKRSLVERAPAPGPSALFAARGASPSKRLAAREPAPSKRLVDPQALALSKRSADAAAPQKRGIDEQHVVQADSQRGFCLDGLMACPVLSTPGQFPHTFAEWEAIGFECVDFAADLSSCGGCSSLDPVQ